MMAAGRHDLELVNETLGYRVTRVVQVPPGKVASLAIDLPKGVVQFERVAVGRSLDRRPARRRDADRQPGVPIGPHEVVFRHPQFGEKRHAISVTPSAPVRLSVDMK